MKKSRVVSPKKSNRNVRLTKAANQSELKARRLLNDALKKLEPRIAVAFGRAALSIRNQPNLLKRLAESIEAGDISGVEAMISNGALAEAMRGQGIDPSTQTFEQELTAALSAGGQAGQAQMGKELSFQMTSLNLTNPQAVSYLQETMPVLIREIDLESQNAIQAALLRGFDEGRPATQIAREVRDSIGLTTKQAVAVSNLRRQLETGQPIGGAISSRRLSGPDKAIAQGLFNLSSQGKKPSQSKIDQVVDKYYQSLLNRRSRNIARTEATRAFGQGQRSIWGQAVERGLLDVTKTVRKWAVTADDRLREEHSAIPSMNPNGVSLNGFYETPIGPVSGPRESGVASFDVNCRCTEYLEFID